MNWDDVREGDTVEIEYNHGGTIKGEVRSRDGGIASVAGVYISEIAYKVRDIRKAYKVGDIGLLKSNHETYIGVYEADGSFYMRGAKMFQDTYENIKILGNVYDE